MSDPHRHVRANEPLSGNLTAAGWNGAMDAAKDFARRRLGSTGAGVPTSSLSAAGEVLVRNDTGDDLAAGAVVRLGGAVVDPVEHPFEVRRRPVVTGVAPAGATDLFAILSEPIPEDGFGRAVVSGFAVCAVHVTDSLHEYAAPTSGETGKLESADGGPAYIVARGTPEEVPGDTTALVLLGGGAGRRAATATVQIPVLIPVPQSTCNEDGTITNTQDVTWATLRITADGLRVSLT